MCKLKDSNKLIENDPSKYTNVANWFSENSPCNIANIPRGYSLL